MITKLMMSDHGRFFRSAFDLAALIKDVMQQEGRTAESVVEIGWKMIWAEYKRAQVQIERTYNQQD